MDHPPSLHRTLPDLVDALLDASGEAERDRVLLAAVFRLGAAEAASLWRSVPSPGGASPRWRPVLEHGPAELLPTRAHVEAALSGHLTFELPHGGRVLQGGAPGRRFALALGGRGKEGEADTLEAFLALWQSVEEPSRKGTPASPLEILQSLLPRELVGDGTDFGESEFEAEAEEPGEEAA